MKFDWGLAVFEDINGHLRELRRCPPMLLSDFRDYLELLQEALSANPALDFQTYYLESSYVRQIVNRCLEICSISPEWLSGDMLTAMLHHQVEDNGDFRAGLLVEFMFPEKGGEGKKVEFKEWVADTVASLISLGFAQNLSEALAIAKTIPSDQLDAIAIARAYQLEPKLRKRHELESAASELNANPTKIKEILDFNSSKWTEPSLADLNKLL